jgi:integrase
MASGCLYRRKKKLADGTLVEVGPYWMKWYRNGSPFSESTHTESKTEAQRELNKRMGDVARGVPVTSRLGQIKIDELLEDARTNYKVNERATLKDLEGRCTNHLIPFFGGRKVVSITTSDVNRFIDKRQQADASNAEINRELAVLKRAFSLAYKAGKILHKPHIPMLKENNVRKGFFERDQFEEVRQQLPAELQPVVTFAYCTGWRGRSEILTRQWQHVDWEGGTVRLDAGESKNDEPREFPFLVDEELTAMLETQKARTEELQKRHGIIIPWVFFRETATGVSRIKDFRKAWETACSAAGVPGRLVHDFRRTAVRNLERAGVSRSVAMLLTGHKTESVYRRYAIVSKSDLSEAVTKLQALKNIHSKSTATVTKTVTVGGTGSQLIPQVVQK